MYRENVRSLLQTLNANPATLERKLPVMAAFLQSQGNAAAQGTGNKVTDQEACFADEATKHGFQFLAKGTTSAADGCYYGYQLGGSQQKGDFGLCEYEGGVIKHAHKICDLKHTTSKEFYLNDGWFEKDVIYIISWNAGTKKIQGYRVYIALGQDIPTEQEQALMTALIAFKADKNSNTAKTGSLRPYIRFANKYSCAAFPEKAAEHFAKVLASI
jgi:hypothetical protein